MKEFTLGRAITPLVAALLWIAVPATTLAVPPDRGSFPIGGHFVGFEPESSLCGFEITADYSGTANFQVYFDESGEPIRVHIHAAWTGTISANGIALHSRSSLNQFFDLDDHTVVEAGLVFQNGGPRTGVALKDRGRLVWSVDPDTGEWLFPPIFEAGPHPQLHGDVAGLCDALSG